MKMPLEISREALQNALDDLSSPRSSSELKTRALETLEQLLASACVSKDSSEDLHNFTTLQYTFECNVPLRLLGLISTSTLTLEVLTNKGTMDHEQKTQASKLSSQLSISLSLIQGVALSHVASKDFLGRKYALDVLLDLLLASRHLSAMPPGMTSSSSSRAQGNTPPLSSIVLDTLLCILVDSPPALRTFEKCNGVQAVVKILKRAGTPREVRMKCLEFLYFYLLDENSSASEIPQPMTTSSVPSLPPTAPSTPQHGPKRSLSSKSLYPSSRFPSTSSLGSSSSTSSRSTSGSSSQSLLSTSSSNSSWTTLSSIASSPEKPSPIRPKTPPNSSPALGRSSHLQLQPRSLMLLRKDVDYTPLSPKKPHAKRSGVSGFSSRHMSRLRLASSGSEDDCQKWSTIFKDETLESLGPEEDMKPSSPQNENRRTTEEKRELLGTMLGNVDALVEGVRKAGIWGLG